MFAKYGPTFTDTLLGRRVIFISRLEDVQKVLDGENDLVSGAHITDPQHGPARVSQRARSAKLWWPGHGKQKQDDQHELMMPGSAFPVLLASRPEEHACAACIHAS